jgi:shikimate dehydrogenase
LLKFAKALKCPTIDGLDMFVQQGAIGFQWWTGQQPDTNLMKKVVMDHLMGTKS